MPTEIKDAVAGKSIHEVASEVEKEIIEQDAKALETSTKEKAQGTEQIDFDNDEDFKRSVPKEFNSHPAWRKNYYEKKEAQRKAEKLESELKDVSSKVQDYQKQLESLQARNPNANEQELTRLAAEKGYTLTKAEKQELKQANKLQQILDNIQDPNDKVASKNYSDALIEAALEKFPDILEKKLEEKYGERDKALHDMWLDNRYEKSKSGALTFVANANKEFGLNIDFTKDIEPELIKMVKSNDKINAKNVDVLALTKEFFATQGIKFGKQLYEREAKELNEKKKSANAETTSTQSVSKKDYSKMSPGEIYKETRKELAGE